ncbi:type IV pilin protein [Dyella sp.]|uniref:type IV pilin protein n=1 Tax=Dyella sp. TaxID=1869338 RepID=UPI002ED246B0
MTRLLARHRGFSLIELLAVLLITALLASIAIPSYQKYIHRSYRTEAKDMLLRIASAQERYFSAQNRYGSLRELGITDARTSHHHYEVDVESDASQFKATARPLGQQTKDRCGSLSLDHTGRRSSSASQQTRDCW